MEDLKLSKQGFIININRVIALIFLVLFINPLFWGNISFATTTTVTPLSVDNQNPIIGDSFNLTVSMNNAVAGSNYFVKCRIGNDSSSLTAGQTYNQTSSTWLDDNDAWVNMPQIPVDTDGSWQGVFQCRIKTAADNETKLLYVWACLNSDNGCSTLFQSTDYLTLSPIYPTATPTFTPTPTPNPTNTPTPIPTSTLTPTPTSNPTSTPTPTPKLTITPTTSATTTAMLDSAQKQTLGQSSNSLFSIPSDNGFSDKSLQLFSAVDKQVISKILIFLGVIFMFLCGIVVFYPKIDNYIKSKKNE